eukprot:gene16100-33797_t
MKADSPVQAKVCVSWLKVPHEPVLDGTECGFHRTGFLRHLVA